MDFKKIINDVKPLYNEPHRHYHTWDHIKYSLHHFKTIKPLINNTDIVKLAIIFHDIIYIPEEIKNEEKTVEFFCNYIHKNREKFQLSNRAMEMLEKWVSLFIIHTKTHVIAKSMPESLLSDLKYFLDLDLLILGETKENFDKYEENIRKEYYFVPWDLYKKGRTDVLVHFLKRENIYFTEKFQKRLEKKARKNIERSIKKFS